MRRPYRDLLAGVVLVLGLSAGGLLERLLGEVQAFGKDRLQRGYQTVVVLQVEPTFTPAS